MLVRAALDRHVHSVTDARSSLKSSDRDNNPGIWTLHCHELHHADGGMMTLIQYAGFDLPHASQGTKSTGDEDHQMTQPHDRPTVAAWTRA